VIEPQQKGWANWWQEALNSLSGAFDLLMRDEQGLQKFNLSANGFWHSFGAIVLIAPIYLFAASTDWSAALGDGPSPHSAIKSFISLCILWVGWPVVALYLFRALSCEKQYARYIIAFNWSTVLGVTFMAIPSILLKANLTSPQAGIFLSFMLLFTMLYYEWYITNKTLGTPMGMSAAIVSADYAVSLIVETILG